MSINVDIYKVVVCLTVIGLAVASGYPVQAQQATQQANCSQQNGQNCVPNADPKIQNGNPYDKPSMYFAPGARDITHANPASQKGTKQPESQGSSGN